MQIIAMTPSAERVTQNPISNVTTKVVTPKTTKNTKTQRLKGKFIHFFFVFFVPLRPLWFVNRGTLAVTIQ